MLRAEAQTIRRRGAHDQRHAHLAAEEIAHLGGLIHDGVGSEGDEIDELDLDDGRHATDCEPDAESGGRGFAERAVMDAVWTELIEQTFVDSERSAVEI